jgi:hypothetical protein
VREFSSFQAARGGDGSAVLSPDTALPVLLSDRARCLSRAFPSRRTGPQGPRGRLSVIMRPRRWAGTARRPAERRLMMAPAADGCDRALGSFARASCLVARRWWAWPELLHDAADSG